MTSSHQFSTLSALFNDAASLEKILKLAQAVSQIIAGLNQGVEEVKRWNAVRGQIALSRRFFRLFKWVDCWTLAHQEYEGGPLYPQLLPSSSSAPGPGSGAARSSASDYPAMSGSERGEQAWPSANEVRSRLDEETKVKNESGEAKGDMKVEAPTDGDRRPQVEAKGNAKKGKDGDEVYTMLAVLKWSLLGMYFFMEMWTITDTMALTSIWQRSGINLQDEALKMWVYGIAASIVLGLYQLFTVYYPVERPTKGGSVKMVVNKKSSNDKSRESAEDSTVSKSTLSQSHDRDGKDKTSSESAKPAAFKDERKRIVKQLVVDCCDILIPASAVGWVRLDGIYVGMAGAMSASINLSGMWMKAANGKRVNVAVGTGGKAEKR